MKHTSRRELKNSEGESEKEKTRRISAKTLENS